MNDTIFSNLPKERIIDSTKYFNVIRDNYPVTPLHTLIIPKRHILEFTDLTLEEETEFHLILKKAKSSLKTLDSTITGFNIGINEGQSAGQTIMHCHIHLIPRRDGDVENPKGGVRGVIPSKQSY
jgi:diadenosine tetraphosphate (Ap4A) HIT family hydrolase